LSAGVSNFDIPIREDEFSQDDLIRFGNRVLFIEFLHIRTGYGLGGGAQHFILPLVENVCGRVIDQ
jgi:hypothetical protein